MCECIGVSWMRGNSVNSPMHQVHVHCNDVISLCQFKACQGPLKLKVCSPHMIPAVLKPLMNKPTQCGVDK